MKTTKIVLRGGCGNALIAVNRVVCPKLKREQVQIEAIRAAREARFDAEAASEAIAMRRHRELRADKQKIAF